MQASNTHPHQSLWLLVDGALAAPRIETIGLERVPDALVNMLCANTTGKIVLRM